MRVVYHLGARLDVLEIVEWYEKEDGPELADRFVIELETHIEDLVRNPLKFGIERKIMRANLKKFPYHFLYRFVNEETLKVLTVKHDRRRPSFGRRRW